MTYTKFLLPALFLILLNSNSFCQDKPPAIEVLGTATISVEPDIMNWTLNIQEDNDNLQEAVTKHDASLIKVMNVLKQNGIEESKIKTSGMRMTKKLYKYGEEKKYGVYNTIWFTSDKIEKYDAISNEVIKIEDVYITSTDLESSKAIETRIQARTNALNAAKEKAQKIAEVLGVTIGKPIFISEAPVDYWSPVQSNVNAVQQGSQTSGSTTLFSQGMISIESRVKVVFEIK